MKLPKFPQVIAKGNSRGTIYRHVNSKTGQDYDEFKLAYYEGRGVLPKRMLTVEAEDRS